MIAFPNCKINLGLHILQKRTDGYHDLETVFLPLPFNDVLEIIPARKGDSSSFTTTGLHVPGSPQDNLCGKAYTLLKKNYPDLPAVQVHLHKVIPAGAGLGGGSADGSFMLAMLNELFKLRLTEERLLQLALQLGSDCPFFIINKPCFSTGRGELLEKISLNLSGMSFLLINPGIHLSTSMMFEQVIPEKPVLSLRELIALPVDHWKESIKNDFEAPAFHLYPEIKQIKEALYQAGAVYAAMSGSGSTVYGLFPHQPPPLSFPGSYFIHRGVL